jgi:hypothetical protein
MSKERLPTILGIINTSVHEGEVMNAIRAARKIQPDGPLFPDASNQSAPPKGWMSPEEARRISKTVALRAYREGRETGLREVCAARVKESVSLATKELIKENAELRVEIAELKSMGLVGRIWHYLVDDEPASYSRSIVRVLLFIFGLEAIASLLGF